MRLLTIVLVLCITTLLNAQYEFKNEIELDHTGIKNQCKTGTCWSFATASFIEAELMRQGNGGVDISEMFVVRNIYKDKARNYILRQGKANFSQGSLSHDLIRIIEKFGVMPEAVYSGLLGDNEVHDHSEMEAGLKGFLDGVLKSKRLSKNWMSAIEAILDVYLGPAEVEFNVGGKRYNPKQYAESLALKSDDYVSLTSFTHHPFDQSFILEIPDNYSNGSFHNVPLDQMISLIDKALEGGYSIAWDGDVSEKGFDAKKGIAVLPEDAKRKDLFDSPGKELKVDQQIRQDNFESYSTTDDHLMHIVGKAKDQKGNEYYIIKNSWGEISPYKGYLYMSKAYAKMKTVAIMVHKDVLSL